jgi:zinc and cadmium transporter
MESFFWILIGGVGMSLIALIGGVTTLLRPAMLERLLLPLVALAAGSLLGGAFFHLIPAGLTRMEMRPAFVWVAAGFAVFLALEQFLHWHHCRRAVRDDRQPMTYLILLGDGLHNFIGGLSIASAYLVNPTLGVTAWLAAVAHEIPQELGDFGVLVHGGWERRRALWWNFLSGLTFLFGAILAWLLSQQLDVTPLILFGAGNFLYLSASDLIPEIKGAGTKIQGSASLLHFLCFISSLLVLYVLAEP